ncbi:5'-methylthioadenosine/S-adenosylhomocysteine nucleosidase [Xylophilus sp. GOD-11R]|uniref:5'-methylthioadenosine/S-adenosylhomocysteine nucleosidase n=1 Tax=Xylophilus sp. GOD-11R TaxID=3089814 RepID=UPI00298C9E5A|nr:5'-methylthioadenosine/S-adenosylhomocysteine nucleosidase [Xylophilus sp. GOD-11R]WPB55228.1 5'-methylthioadenosine/S-adenosylhomocysteine nucleosidase [Xylophilus sp. GOD-11R]
MPSGEPGRLDVVPRVAVVSAFEPELALLLAQVQQPRRYSVQGVEFTTGTLGGRPVVLFLSGISMVNAAMNTQRALDLFQVTHIVFSGIAGGVNPQLHIGDVSVPAQWGQYLEVLAARETSPGVYAPPSRMGELPFAPFGMFYPRPVDVVSAAQPKPRKQFWFAVDAGMLAAARVLQSGGAVTLADCDAARRCLRHAPRLAVGGNGVSGASFMDNAALRQYTFSTFAANVIDMETAATAQVAASNGVPYIAFRSLSDLAGGGEGENEMKLFLSLAAENSARVVTAFLQTWKP